MSGLPLAQCRRLLRPDRKAMAVRNVNRRAGPHQQGGRSRCPPRALRSGLGDAHPLQGPRYGQDLGVEAGEDEVPRQGAFAVARKLAVIMHAMWRDGTFYAGDPDASTQDVAALNAAKVQRLSYANS